jgi:hypothetical protein
MPNSNTSETTVNFESLDEDGLGDESEGGNFLQDTVVGGLVERDGVLGLILDLSLGPLLFLGGFSSRGGCGGFGFSLESETKKKRSANGLSRHGSCNPAIIGRESVDGGWDRYGGWLQRATGEK